MESLIASGRFTNKDLKEINYYRVYLQVFYISYITNIKGNKIAAWAGRGQKQAGRDLPPGAALGAVEELGLARFKPHDSLIGIVVVPLLLKPEWFRRYVKNVDLYFFIPVDAISQWPTSMHEGLTIGVFLPLLRYNPWEWSNVSFMDKLGSTLSALYRTDAARAEHLLREFWIARTWVASMPQRIVNTSGKAGAQIPHLSLGEIMQYVGKPTRFTRMCVTSYSQPLINTKYKIPSNKLIVNNNQ
jgi:hypothetical protein